MRTRLLAATLVPCLALLLSDAPVGAQSAGVTPAAAQAASAKPAAAHAHGAPAAPAKPVVLMPGMGSLHHPISVRNPEAQRFFDQGLTLVFGFNHEEAIRSFKQAARLDPRAPMPLWGAALALGPNINMPRAKERDEEAYALVTKAQALVASGSEVEKAYVEALAARYSNDPLADLRSLDEAYRDAMRELSRAYPDDLDAATLYAESIMDLNPWKFWSVDGKAAKGTGEIIAVLESVLKRNPNHPGANHYYIHAVEASPRPERGLASAQRLETLVPGAGHLVHMPGHIYMQTGDYAGAARVNMKAADADRMMFRNFGRTPMYPVMYYNHNLHFIAASRSMEGRFVDAVKAADDLRAAVVPIIGPATLGPDFLPFLETFMASPLFVRLRFQKWDEIVKMPAPDARLPVNTLLWRAARAIAFIGKKDTKRADAERQAFEAARAALPEGGMFGFNSATDIATLAAAMIDGRSMAAEGELDGAAGVWSHGVDLEDGMAYNEPSDWFYPMRESLGGALLRAGRAGEAEETFRACLERHPRDPRALFGLWKSLLAQKRTVDAGWVKRQLDDVWMGAALRVEDL